MDKTKKKKVQMPSGIRSKLTAAIAMLLISSLLVVGSTYAWFTLSTAPEVTGITTSVGANGNLEIALLNGVASGSADTDTFADMSKIQSAVGNSSEASGMTVPKANITWGNLVDLSDASYGLTGIKLLPADLNKSGDNLVPGSLLKTPVYGADGRVKELEANTVSAVYNSTNGNFPYDSATQSYGVRAIGVTTTMSARQLAFGNAKRNVGSVLTTAKSGTKSAISNNMGALMVFAGVDAAPPSYTEPQLVSFRAIAAGIVSDIAALENGYRNAMIAVAASTAADDSAFATQKATIESADLAGLQTAATSANQTAMAAAIGTLKTAQDNAISAKNTLSTATVDTPAQTVTDAIKLLIGNSPDKVTTGAGVDVYISDGVVGELANQLGKFELASVTGIATAYAGAQGAATTGTYNAVVGTVNTLGTPGGTTTANISDTYGYVIDFAFRTNASGANLQLQTAEANRVYTDGSAATQGAGSTVTFEYTSGLTAAQANTLLSNIKLVFFNPETGVVYTNAELTDITTNTTSATAKVTVGGQTGDVGTITALAQNTATKVSVLVYLDGNSVQNKDVANATTSGNLNLNLQFSSSVPLQPMQNTALKTMPVTP